MQINYLIIAHKNLAQLERLVSALDHETSRIFIHIDKKITGKEIKQYKFPDNNRVTLVKNRIAVNWGGFSMVMATLKLMQTAQAAGKGYFVLLSGEDFPLQKNEYIYHLLSASYGKEYLEYAPLPYEHWSNGGMDRIHYYWLGDTFEPSISKLFFDFQKSNDIRRPWFEGFSPYGGSQWWCLTYECIQYILKFIRHNPLIVEFFKSSIFADEVFFTTIVLNSPFKSKAVNDNLRYIVWEMHAANPRLLDRTDYTSLINSGKLWGRKFDMRQDPIVLEKLETYFGRHDFSKTIVV